MRSLERGLGIWGALSWLLVTGCQSPTSLAVADADRAEIQAIMQRQAQAWNRGDLVAFLADYENSDEMTFISRADLIQGKDALLAKYENSYPEGERGVLSFSDLSFRRLGSQTVLVLGVWSLQLPPEHPHGRFTLVFRRGDRGFKILHDHSSGAEPED